MATTRFEPADFLAELNAVGLTLVLRNDSAGGGERLLKLLLGGNKAARTDLVRAAIAEHRVALIDYLSNPNRQSAQNDADDVPPLPSIVRALPERRLDEHRSDHRDPLPPILTVTDVATFWQAYDAQHGTDYRRYCRQPLPTANAQKP